MAALLGSEPVLIDELYHSESATNFDNRSITWLLQEYGRIYDDPEMSLDLYTRQCSLGVTAEQLAISAATIADDGVNPLTKQRAFGAELTSKVVALMERRRLLRALGRLAVCPRDCPRRPAWAAPSSASCPGFSACAPSRRRWMTRAIP